MRTQRYDHEAGLGSLASYLGDLVDVLAENKGKPAILVAITGGLEHRQDFFADALAKELRARDVWVGILPETLYSEGETQRNLGERLTEEDLDLGELEADLTTIKTGASSLRVPNYAGGKRAGHKTFEPGNVTLVPGVFVGKEPLSKYFNVQVKLSCDSIKIAYN